MTLGFFMYVFLLKNEYKEYTKMVWLLWSIPLIVFVFLWTLNDFLRGHLKEVANVILFMLITLFTVIAFFVSGWKIGMVTIIGVFVTAALFRAPALAIARRLIKYPDIGADIDPNETVEEFEMHMQRAVSKSIGLSQIRAVLDKWEATEEDLIVLYQIPFNRYLPPTFREQVICNPALVEYFFEHSEPTTVGDKYTRHVSSLDVSLALQGWSKLDPSGKSFQT